MNGFSAGSSLVRWVEGHGFFGRPRLEKRQFILCQDAAKYPDYNSRFNSCKVKAAGNCMTPDDSTRTADACVCSTLAGYLSKFSVCFKDTPYSNCYDTTGNIAAYSSYSTAHCKALPPTTSSIPPPSTTPKPAPPSSPAGPAVTSTLPPPAASSPKSEPKSGISSAVTPKPPANSDQTKPTDPPSRSTPGSAPVSVVPVPGPTSDKPEAKSDKTTQSTPTSVPELSLVTVEVARTTPGGAPAGTDASTTSSASRIPLARWNGNGALLNGYCATPEYTIIDGPTAYWAPVVGCMRSKADCCPFDIAPSTVAIAARAAETSAAATTPAAGGNGGFPDAVSPVQATLSKCPSDYHSVGNGCCPLNYYPWTTTFGGQTPCYSTMAGATTPPPIGANVPSKPSQPTSAIVNVVYAMQYPLQATEPAPSPGLATGAKIGIGAGAGAAALIFGLLAFLLLRKHKAHKRDKKALEEMSGIGSTRQSVANSSAFGGVKAWQTKVASSEVSSGLETVQEPTLPQVAMPQRTQYPADWRPGQRSVSLPVQAPHPGYYHRESLPSPSIPEGYSEVGSDNGRRSELYSGDVVMQRQELQNGYQEGYQAYGGHEQWQQQAVAQPLVAEPVRYYEVPAGRATPRI